MIICDKFIFIHLQKCAGTFVREFLFKIFPNCKRYGSEHSGVRDIPESQRDKLIIGTIRNPHDWYLSWYSKRKNEQDGLFKNLFACEFKEFLRRCFFTEERTLHDIEFHKIREQGIGHYTYRYNRCYEAEFKPNLHIIKTEELREGLIGAPLLSEEQIKIFDNMERLNSSTHGDYSDYYDQEMLKWVEEKDQLIFERHGYEVDG